MQQGVERCRIFGYLHITACCYGEILVTKHWPTLGAPRDKKWDNNNTYLSCDMGLRQGAKPRTSSSVNHPPLKYIAAAVADFSCIHGHHSMFDSFAPCGSDTRVVSNQHIARSSYGV